MKETTISDIERINVAILIIGSILSLLIMKDFRHLFSFAVASAIMILNFRILRKIIENGFLQSTEKKRAFIIALPFKFLALATAVVVVLIYGDIDVVFFLVGLSTVFMAILITQIHILMIPILKRRQKNGA
ncbi:MAG: hypothetical protein C0399_10685 [Syntrophus sp. (in: bacteria)]|nr:hypothetical protein [Syntrophus sp. (in: bacteria)]